MVRPISLRIRASEVTADARRLLRRLDEKDRLQRRIKWMALKALISVGEMRRDAATLKSGDRRWHAEVKVIESILSRISIGRVTCDGWRNSQSARKRVPAGR